MASRSLQLRKPTTKDIDRLDQIFCLVMPTGKAYVTIEWALGYAKSQVRIQNPLEGVIPIPVGDTVRPGSEGDSLEVANDDLYIAGN